MPSSLYLFALVSGNSFAGEFFTIIGPDGRPMVVQRKANEIQVKKPKQELNKVETAQQEEREVSLPMSISKQPQVTSNSPQVNAEPKIVLPKQMMVQPVVPPAKEQAVLVKVPKVLSSSMKTEIKVQDSPLAAELRLKTNQAILAVPIQATKLASAAEKAALIEKDEVEILAVATTIFSQMDGANYVRNEYLEDREFNLEGKHRFYTMPEGVVDHKTGATRFQVVEREKGVSKSVLDSIFKPKHKENTAPIALATSYYRMSKQDTVESLGEICFNDKKMKKAKTLQANQDINVWPKKPLKEQFEFEIIKVERNVQNIQLNSYASTQRDPTFYWPFVVFLDEKACVLEGAGGFKNDENSSSKLSHEMITGILHVPEQSHYLLLTPLASAVDVEHKVLTNHGQLKLIAIR